MDTTAEYIKMCHLAKEIQDNTPFFSIRRNCIYGNAVSGETGRWIERVNTDNYKQWVWLPRQDELQNILGNHIDQLNGLVGLLADSYHPYGWDAYLAGLKSMEQLWLAYVMYKKYSKKWNGKTWKKHHFRPRETEEA